MATKTTFASAMLLFFGVLFTACPFKECLEQSQTFEIKYRFSPPDSLLKVGDTLWLTSRFSCKALTNLVTKMPEDYCNATISSTFSIISMKSSSSIPAVDSFDFISVKGRILTALETPSPNQVKQINFNSDANQYELKVGLLCKRRGYYSFGINDGLGTIGSKVEKCNQAGIISSIENTEQNLRIYQRFRVKPPTEYESTRIYCIQVR
jgi:hypothetical protein